MAAQVRSRKRLDPKALEARTQAIGQQLFAEAKRQHAHFSSWNRWTEQLLAWCLRDPRLKADVLRFVDVLPSLQSPRDIARHVREYFPTSDHRLPATLRVGARLAGPGLLTAPAVASLIRQLIEQLARQFIAESRPEGLERVVRALALRGAACSLDLLGEAVLSEAEADRYVAQYQQLLRRLHDATAALADGVPKTCGPLVNLSIKPSALTPRFDPISPSTSIEQAARRLLPVLQQADASHALINLDMEHYELRDLTLELAKHLVVHPGIGPHAELGIVLQAYLRDSEQVLEELLGWLAAHERTLTIRLVKGAYWDYEVAQARQRSWPVPVYLEKAQSDLAFERMTVRLLGAAPLVRTAIASHNVRAIAHAMAVAEALQRPRDQIEFQFLFGMGDAIQAAVTSLGYPVRIYTPIGDPIPGMAYLVRRLLENTSNDSFLRHEYLRERSAEQLLAVPAVRDAAIPAEKHPVSETPWRSEPPRDFSLASCRDGMAKALERVRGQLGHSYPLLVRDGDLDTREALSVRNPAHPDTIIGRVAQAGSEEVQRALKAAGEGQRDWSRVPVAERTACLRRAASLMRARRDELAAWEVCEVGKPWREADADVAEAIDYLEYYSAQMEDLAGGRALRQCPGERNAYVYRARGIAVVIAPWNFPLAILTGMSSAALAAGNAVILKPAEQSPVIAYQYARLLREAGVPPPVAQYLPGLGETVGAALVAHPAVSQILFTGSRAVGLSIIEQAAGVREGQRGVKHVVAEMGGKNAILIDADADVDAAVAGSLRSMCGYAGQKCSAASRLIVHDAVFDAFVSRLAAALDRLVIGDPSDPGVDLGPLIEAAAQRRLQDARRRAGQVGTVLYAYPDGRLPSSGYFVGPTLVGNVPRDEPLAREELFGPLACVFRVKRFQEALELANDTDDALTGGVYSRSPEHLTQAAQSFDVGNLYFNRPITGALVGRQPFGGHRLSGLGTKAGGPDYLLQMLLPQSICENTARHGMPLDPAT